ncbi:flavin-containing monooxygenase [Microbacterium sp. No. 7]|uniref:flavin-containing monooxygenase n=1 Tax=Microbacterium sp. No. 7 TaxID=1714373 RepID=UPI0006D1FB52|nr:NAD(P)/FAD-dependent oxidoreductase [Microbacterium sp. No. 7]ALJ18836.1 monooxygenase [Microbacterium sp. No. 7]
MMTEHNRTDETPDLEAVRAKYREERDRRLLKEDRDANLDLSGEFGRYLDDPYTEWQPREAVSDDVDVVVIGAGWAGLLTAAKLRNAGFRRIRIIEKAGDVAGVWYWNRYPGAMCDVQSYIYLPLLEEVGYMPERKYSYAEEIFAYAQKFARHFDLYDLALFQTGVTGLTWDEDSARWIVETDRSDVVTAPYVVICNGSFANPKLPAIPGIETFAGKMFHTSRWDYDYTGGAAHEFLDKLGDTRVGVIGTGATSVQIVPPLGEAAKHLYVFQRTPSTIGVRGNALTDHEKMNALPPGWQKEWRDNFTRIISSQRETVDHVDDGWTQLYRKTMSNPAFDDVPPEKLAEARELADLERMEEIRHRIDEVVKDPRTAEALKPYYRYMCKRPCFHDEYLETFNRDNVTLVDSQGLGIDRITETGVVVGGTEYEVDCLVFATGFDQETLYTDRVGFDVVGRDGVRLSEKWRGGISTLHGMLSRGFPNLVIAPVNNAQSSASVNFVHHIEENADHTAYLLSTAVERGIRAFDVSSEAEAEWVRTIQEGARLSSAFLEECTPSRWNNEGRLDERSLSNANYAGAPTAFFALLQEWRDNDDLKGLEILDPIQATA